MSRGINKVTLVGNLGVAPEKKYLPSGDAVINFTVATNDKWVDRKTQEKKGSTEWHNIIIYGQLAELMYDLLERGSRVYLEGKNRTKKWHVDGVAHSKTYVVCRVAELLHLGQEVVLSDRADADNENFNADDMK